MMVLLFVVVRCCRLSCIVAGWLLWLLFVEVCSCSSLVVVVCWLLSLSSFGVRCLLSVCVDVLLM